MFALPARKKPPVASVPVHWHFWSAHPSVPVDFRASGLLSALRFLLKVRNFDGPDDTVTTIILVASQSGQPYLQASLLTALGPLVALAAKNAVRHARTCYELTYPAAVAALLLQQSAAIQSLRLDSIGPDGGVLPGLAEVELAHLESLQGRGVQAYLRRCEERHRGVRHLVGHNLRRRRYGFPGNGELSRQFDLELRRIMDERMARSGAPASEHVCYEAARVARAGELRHAAKVGRIPGLITGIALSGMFAGMTTSIAEAAGNAVHNRATDIGNVALAAATDKAAHAAELVTGVVMGISQCLQGLASVQNQVAHRGEYQRLQEDLSGVQALAESMSPEALQVFEQDVATRLHASVRSQVLDGTLTAGQGLMLLSTILHFFLPGAAFLIAVAGPGAVATIASAVLTAKGEERSESFQGASVPQAVQARHTPLDTGMQIRAQGNAAVTGATAAAYLQEQRDAEQIALWALMADMLAGEDTLASRPARSAAERHEALAARIGKPRDKAHLMAVGIEGLQKLLADRYPVEYFDRPLREIHRALATEMAGHPASAVIEELEEFRQELLYQTVRALARRPHARDSAPFRATDGSRRDRIEADDAWKDFVLHDPAAHAVETQARNVLLARALGPVGFWRRFAQQEVLTHLGRGEHLRKGLAREHGLAPDNADTAL